MTQRSLELTAETGITFDAAVISEEALGWARAYSGELVKGITDTTRKLVSESVSTFIETPGMTRGDLERLLEPAFGPNKASQIAVTEVTRAYSQATNKHQEMLKREYDLEMRRVWQTRRDDLVCPICGPLNGMPEDDWPANLKGGPPAHVNCRCGDSLTSDDAETLRAEAITSQTAREKLLREKVAGEKPGVALTETPLPSELWQPDTADARAYADWQISEVARRHRTTPEKVQARIAERLREDLNGPVTIRRGLRGSQGIISDSRFKSQFETGTSRGLFDKGMRKTAEYHGLGAPLGLPDGERVIYGYFATGNDAVSSYGQVEWQLKDTVKQRTTYTIGDSLGAMRDREQVGSRDPEEIGAWDGEDLDRYYSKGVGRADDGIGYLEAQIQGGVNLGDVERVRFHLIRGPTAFEDIADELTKLGIPWDVTWEP